jgi:hypothetical protein
MTLWAIPVDDFMARNGKKKNNGRVLPDAGLSRC